MTVLKVDAAKSFNTTIWDIAPDKSISHRAAIFALLSDKSSYIENFLEAEDSLNSLKIVQSLGASVKKESNHLIITPPSKINEPASILDCGNSGTAMRLLIGFLAGVDGFFTIHGDKYLATRPMNRVVDPLREIGANIDGREKGNLSPISIRGSSLNSFNYDSKIASAQVKSAMILAALRANGVSTISEPFKSRDHTEKMLLEMGAKIEIDGLKNIVHPMKKPLKPLEIYIGADPSSAFFFALAAAIVPKSSLTLKKILLNPTRIEAFEVLKKMGANIEYKNISGEHEKVGDIEVSYSKLKAVNLETNIAWLIDEIPALAIAFACASGVSRVKNAKELRVKESDRI
ncbi:MAG: 3-phosphoshikimate 1-carboxyvinyltransferase, partial [Sulfurospirillaceae bacterium]|nr:3-phosphoshikimate 1-carboxyvinyltransferase [Sulfurospirillaceae bacterium]